MRIFIGLLLLMGNCLYGQIVISANENKIDLSPGSPKVLLNPEPDTLTIMDFRVFPPKVRHLHGIPNSVLGPPSTIALTPDEGLALVASPLMIDPQNPEALIPDDKVRVISIGSVDPKVIETVKVGKQPSGLCISSDGKLAIVANRAEGSFSLLSIEGQKVRLRKTYQVGEASDQICDAAINPAGDRFVVTNGTQNQAHLFSLSGFEPTPLEVFSVFGSAYHTEITPDGELAVIAGGGLGKGTGALTIIDLAAAPTQVSDVVMIGTDPESFDISPDGELIAAVLMSYSNRPPNDPRKTTQGQMVLLQRQGRTFQKVQQLPIGPVPQGVTFTADGQHLLVQSHPRKEIQVYSIAELRIKDTGVRIPVPGRPSSIRAAEAPR